MRRFALVAAVVTLLAGCRSDGPTAGRAGLPPSGKVRIVPTRIQEDAKHFSWLWTVVGERNWTTVSTVPSDMRLGASYPMNSKDKIGGTNIWEARVIIDTVKTGPAPTYVLHLQLRGSNAAMSESRTPIDVGTDGSLTAIARAVQSTETIQSLPATLTLANVGRRNVTLRIDP